MSYDKCPGCIQLELELEEKRLLAKKGYDKVYKIGFDTSEAERSIRKLQKSINELNGKMKMLRIDMLKMADLG